MLHRTYLPCATASREQLVSLKVPYLWQTSVKCVPELSSSYGYESIQEGGESIIFPVLPFIMSLFYVVLLTRRAC